MGNLLGIDGGGTRTTAWLAGEEERVLARVEVGPSNPLKVGWRNAQQELLIAFREVCRKAHTPAAKLEALSIGLAGSALPPLHDKLLRWLTRSIPAHSHLLTTDAAIALAAAVGNAPGIIVVAGTGSIAYGRDWQGHELRCGGWGNLFDDAGSGYDLGRNAVRCGLRALDGRGKPTLLTGALCRKLGFGSLAEAVSYLQAPQDIAALFQVVVSEAARGDAVARQLCDKAARDLAQLALTLLTRLGSNPGSPRVICAGGVFRESTMIRRQFAQQVHAEAPKARVSLLRREPVEGALFLARQLAQTQRKASVGTSGAIAF